MTIHFPAFSGRDKTPLATVMIRKSTRPIFAYPRDDE
jgi:hypothetical protein